MRVKFENVRDVNTRVVHEGRGYPLLLIHAVGYSADTWLRNVDPLARHVTVQAPDLIGHGFTDFVDYAGAAPQQRMLEHLLDYVSMKGWSEFAVLGSSLGAQLATLMYFEMPERVRQLILVGSGSTFSTESELSRALPKVMQNALSALEDPSWESCRERIRNTCHNLRVVPEEIILSQLTSYARNGMRAFYEETLMGLMNMDKVRPHRVYERLEEIAVPTLIISGREDTRAPFNRAVEASKRLRNAVLVPIEDCGHLPYVEHPEVFNSAVEQFLTSNQGN